MKPVIFYGVCGEGLTNLARAKTIINKLNNDYVTHVFTFGAAYERLLSEAYPYLHQIKGLNFGYSGGAVSFVKTTANFVGFMPELDESVDLIGRMHFMHNPVMYITDFEPAVPRAGLKAGVPTLSIGELQKYSRCDGAGQEGFKLGLYATAISAFVERFIPDCEHNMIVNYSTNKITEKYTANTSFINPCVRDAFESVEVTNDGTVLVYFKCETGPAILDNIATVFGDKKVIVYGAEAIEKRFWKATWDRFEHKHFDSDGYVTDFAKCDAIFCTASFQTLCEAKFLQKRTFAIPATGQLDQYVNARLVELAGMGVRSSNSDIEPADARRFIDNFKVTDQPKLVNGATQVYDYVKSRLSK